MFWKYILDEASLKGFLMNPTGTTGKYGSALWLFQTFGKQENYWSFTPSDVVKAIEKGDSEIYQMLQIPKDMEIDERALKKIMEYYNNNSSVKNIIDNGGMSIFAFEGLGNNEGQGINTYYPDGRFGAMMVVMNGSKINYVTCNASTLPDNPVGKAVLNEGVYHLGGKKHKGRYPALQVYGFETMNADVPASYKGNNSRHIAQGINIHTAPNQAASSWSEGCHLVMTKDYIDFAISTGSVSSDDEVAKILNGIEIENATQWKAKEDENKISYNEDKFAYPDLLKKMENQHTEGNRLKIRSI